LGQLGKADSVNSRNKLSSWIVGKWSLLFTWLPLSPYYINTTYTYTYSASFPLLTKHIYDSIKALVVVFVPCIPLYALLILRILSYFCYTQIYPLISHSTRKLIAISNINLTPKTYVTAKTYVIVISSSYLYVYLRPRNIYISRP